MTSGIGIDGQFIRKMRSHKVKPNGYAILMVLFFVALLVISVVTVAPNIITEGRREKETEMIWRGKQYVRGVRLYYQKTHHFPTQLEDLYKPKVGVRFMRQAYKDPMNSEDGSWRLICVGPNGQLLGSLKDNRNKFFFGSVAPAGSGALPASPAASPAGSNNPFASSFGSNSSARPNAARPVSPSDNSSLSNNALSSPPTDNSSGSNAIPSAPPPNNSSGSGASVSTLQSPPSGTVPASQVPNPPDSQNNPSPAAGTADSPPQNGLQSFGSSPLPVQTIIIGVGSKIDKASIAKYDGAKNYLQFEFVWNGVSATPGPVVPSP